MTKAPWTAKEVSNLVARQKDSEFTPYMCKTCPADSNRKSTILVPTDLGWACPTCGRVVQTWAYVEDVSGDYRTRSLWR